MSEAMTRVEFKCDLLEALQEQGMARKEKLGVSPGDRVDRVLYNLDRMGWAIVRKGENP
ncbi:hypothetical protein GFGA_1c1220 [Gluconobacter frateurii NBRC 103465]|nr:hypothetical protein GFGA_1c1220 [Gluconobacter frateurii NBRC 103465]